MSRIYYSQADNRWASHPYASSSHPNGTIKSSGCGATSAAMVVSSFRDIITPDSMGDLFISNGFRGAEGTKREAFPWIAERYGLKCELKWKLDEAMACLRAGGMVIVLCSKGLFTTGGHYIVLSGLRDENTITVFDPYLYSNKFNQYDRAGKAEVDGTNVYVSYSNFKEYAHYSPLYCYYVDENVQPQPVIITPVTKSMYVSTQSKSLNVRNDVGGTIVDSIAKGTQVTVYEERSGWSRIGDSRWVSSAYLSSSNNSSSNTSSKYILGKYVVKVKSTLNVRKSPINGAIVKTYKNGTRFDTYEIKGNWAKTPSGWVCLDYCNLVYKY